MALTPGALCYRWQILDGRYQIAGYQVWTGDRWESYSSPLYLWEQWIKPGIAKIEQLDQQAKRA